MPIKVSEMTEATSLSYADEFLVNDGGVSKRVLHSTVRQFIGARLKTNAFTLVNAAVWSWASADFDTSGFFNANSCSFLTVPASGFYQITACMNITGNSDHAIILKKNGNVEAVGYCAGGYTRPLISWMDRCVPNDRFDIELSAGAGSTSMPSSGSYFSIGLLGY